MNITRNNYEECFLLYADGELSAADKLAVEKFVTLHPDLADELEMLMDTVLLDENITMPGKEFLLKPELVDEQIISTKQEAMLMLLDNELSHDASQKLQKEIAADKNLQFEWGILQQTKLLADAVAIPGKEALYRHEKDRKPVPIFGYTRWIAAAAIVTGLGWFGLSFLNNKNNSSGTVATSKNQVQTIVKPVVNSAFQPAPVVVVNHNAAEADNKNKHAATVETAQVNPGSDAKKQNLQTQQTQTQPEAAEPTMRFAAKTNLPAVNAIEKPVITQNTIAGIDASQLKPVEVKLADNSIVTPVIAQNTPYKEDNIDEETEYINIAGARIKKQKLRNVFRNVTRTIGRGFEKSNVAQADVASLR